MYHPMFLPSHTSRTEPTLNIYSPSHYQGYTSIALSSKTFPRASPKVFPAHNGRTPEILIQKITKIEYSQSIVAQRAQNVDVFGPEKITF